MAWAWRNFKDFQINFRALVKAEMSSSEKIHPPDGLVPIWREQIESRTNRNRIRHFRFGDNEIFNYVWDIRDGDSAHLHCYWVRQEKSTKLSFKWQLAVICIRFRTRTKMSDWIFDKKSPAQSTTSFGYNKFCIIYFSFSIIEYKIFFLFVSKIFF